VQRHSDAAAGRFMGGAAAVARLCADPAFSAELEAATILTFQFYQIDLRLPVEIISVNYSSHIQHVARNVNYRLAEMRNS
jgi:hypothetical protein